MISPLPLPLISPHPKAPIFSTPDGVTVLSQVISEVASGSFPTNERFLQILRQAGLVNLWFFLSAIASYGGPFESLTPHLHLDMCNFWQEHTIPGGRAGGFIPRGHFKTTCWTEGGSAWRLLRDGDEKLRVTAATYDRAMQFMHTIKAVFDSNPLVAELYPECCPKGTQKRWNDKEIVLPNRTKHAREPSVLPGGASGSAEGMHFTGHVCDDLFGEKLLNAMRGAGDEMMSIKNWFWVNAPSLLMSPRQSWVFVVGTRYSMDDLYGEIIERACSIYGGKMPNWIADPSGVWSVYYRQALEDGEPIFPEAFSQGDFDQIAKDDWWTWATQYMNNPTEAGLSEFVKFELEPAKVDYHHDEYWVSWEAPQLDGVMDTVEHPLTEFDVIMTVDPAATERYVSARTSRTAVGVLATHWTGKRVLIDVRADYVDAFTMFDWLFDLAERYAPYLRATFLESNAGFKILGPLIRREQARRGLYLGLRPFPAVGEKTARIRSTLNPEFARKNILVADGYVELVDEEAKSFPTGRRQDVLDMLASAVRNAIIPPSPDEQALRRGGGGGWNRRKSTNLTGY